VYGWRGGRFEDAGDLRIVDGRQRYTVVEEGSRGSRGSLGAAVLLMMMMMMMMMIPQYVTFIMFSLTLMFIMQFW
jgi:hypothetical protein